MKNWFWIYLLLSLAAPIDSAYSDELEAKLYLHSGLVAGYETKTSEYDESSYRIMLELGSKWSNVPIRFLDSFESVSLAWNLALSGFEARHSIGPKLEWRLSDDWTVMSMVGPAFGGRKYRNGFHASVGFVRKNKVSLELLYYRMPPGPYLESYTNNSIHSIYGGVIIHGKPGGYLALTIISVTALVMFGIANAMGS